jgi:hypothetical protein
MWNLSQNSRNFLPVNWDPLSVMMELVKGRYGEPEGGSEWELIKILLEGDEGSNKTNTASNTRL